MARPDEEIAEPGVYHDVDDKNVRKSAAEDKRRRRRRPSGERRADAVQRGDHGPADLG